jgi:hypothetical protein
LAKLTDFSDSIADVYAACEDQLLVNLAKHFNVSAMGNTASFNWDVKMLAKLGAIRRESASIIAELTGGNSAMIDLAVEASILDALDGVEPDLQAAAKAGLLQGSDIPMSDSIRDTLRAYSDQAVDQMNLVNTVMLDDVSRIWRDGVATVADLMRDAERLLQTQAILNRETGKVITGVSTLDEAIKSTVRQMNAAGVTGFIDHGGHHWSPEAYARMDIKTTCSNAANQAVLNRNRQFGNDNIWVRVNATARPGCYPWQGKVINMSNRSFRTVDGEGHSVQVYPVGSTTYGEPDGIYGINCHHGPMNVFIPGFSAIDRTPVPAKTGNDERYALTQQQRKQERKIRYAKREKKMLIATGAATDEDIRACDAQIRRRQQQLRELIDEHPDILRRRYDREQVY